MKIGLDVVRTGGRGLDRLLTELNGAKDAGVRAAASVLRNSIRKELRTPGSGTAYPSRKARSARNLQQQATSLAAEIRDSQATKRGLTSRRKRLANVTRRLDAIGKQQAAIDKARSKVYGPQERAGLHRASAPGESPAPDVGTLPFAVQATRVDNEMRVGVVGRWPGWAALLEGRGRVKGQRPFMTRGLNRVRSKLGPVFVGEMQKRGPK